MNPVKAVVVLLFVAILYYYLDNQGQQEKNMQEQLLQLQQQVDVKDQQIQRHNQHTEKLIQQVASQVDDSKHQQQKIDQKLHELNEVSQQLAEQQASDKAMRADQKKQQALQKKRSKEALKATYLSQGFQTMSMLKQQIVEYYMVNERFPRSNKELGVARPNKFATDAIRSIWISRGGRISVVYSEKSGVENGTISLTPKVKDQLVKWKCTTKDFVKVSHYFPQCQYL